jgi:hypothetical protein
VPICAKEAVSPSVCSAPWSSIPDVLRRQASLFHPVVEKEKDLRH